MEKVLNYIIFVKILKQIKALEKIKYAKGLNDYKSEGKTAFLGENWLNFSHNFCLKLIIFKNHLYYCAKIPQVLLGDIEFNNLLNIQYPRSIWGTLVNNKDEFY